MSRSFAPNALLARDSVGVRAHLDAIDTVLVPSLPGTWLVALEALLHTADAASAQRWASAALARRQTIPAGVRRRLERGREALRGGGLLLIAPRGLRVLPDGLLGTEGHITLTRASADHGPVVPLLLDAPLPGADELTTDAFGQVLDDLARLGLVAPPVGQLSWGDLRRSTPVCQVFGAGRGTPIDRHYLGEFVAEVRDQIVGDVLTVGGRPADRIRFRLDGLRSWHVLDLEAGPGVDLVGDAHDATAVPDGSLDSVLLFNVLEHCREPRTVATNVRRWLRVGGRCFVMVPNAQRLHDAPEDLWRFNPSGLASVFEAFTTEVRTYGSLTTVLASHLGVAAEELTPEELDLHQPDHPVATCLVATK